MRRIHFLREFSSYSIHYAQYTLTLIAALTLAGCSPSAAPLDPKLSAERERLLLKDEPSEPVGIMELREGGLKEKTVTLFGKIGGRGQTWSPNSAEFMLSDPTADVGSGHQCSDGDCAFCRNKRSKTPEPFAIVQFHSEDGQLLPVDARRLLSLEDSQMVVVRGKASVDTLGNLVVAADGIYVRR